MCRQISWALPALNRLREFIWERATTLLAVVVAVMGIAQYLLEPSWIGHELSTHLLSESLGIAFTVGLIDNLIRVRDRRRTRAPRFAGYLEACRLLGYIVGTWTDIVKSTITSAPPAGADLFSASYVQEVSEHFNIDADRGMWPEEPWRGYLKRFPTEISQRVNRIIQRYGTFIDPNLISVLTTIESIPTFLVWGHLDLIRNVAAQHGKYPINGLPIVDGFTERELPKVKELQQILAALSSEFVHMPGYQAPPDAMGAAAVETMRQRDDIAPKIGSGRR